MKKNNENTIISSEIEELEGKIGSGLVCKKQKYSLQHTGRKRRTEKYGDDAGNNGA